MRFLPAGDGRESPLKYTFSTAMVRSGEAIQTVLVALGATEPV